MSSSLIIKKKVQYIAGTDEAGRGPLAGPVIAAAVILDPKQKISGLADSKLLSEKKREYLYECIVEKALSYAIGRAEVHEIDELNILHASLLAMQRAVMDLHIQPHKVVVDGNRCPILSCETKAYVKGDQRIPSISAASILAKVTRDREMHELDKRYPGYGFAQHKGYPTEMHFAKLQLLGASPIHRKTFAPVRDILEVLP